MIYLTQHIKSYQLSKSMILSYKGAKSKYLKIWSQGWFWDFTFFYLQYLFVKLLEGLDVKAVSSCKMDVLKCLYMYFAQIHKLVKSLFLEINFFINLLHCLQWNYHILRMQCPISTILNQNWAERTRTEDIPKSLFWTSDPNGPFWCVESQLSLASSHSDA